MAKAKTPAKSQQTKPPKAAKPLAPDPDVKYPELKAYFRNVSNPLTVKEAKSYLGWEEDTDKDKFLDKYVTEIELPSGRRVRLANNMRNRWIRKWKLDELIQDFLLGRIVLNPDGIGIGRTGEVMSAQHRLIAFVVAEYIRLANTEEGEHWRKIHPEPLTFPCIVVVGLDESDETFRILNTGSASTAADVFYRQGLFKKQDEKSRRALCAMIESALRTFSVRSGTNLNGYLPENKVQLNTSEAVDLLERHPGLVDAALHIFEEYNSGPGHGRRLGSGTATAFLYFMGTAASERDAYDKNGKTEKGLNLDLWSKAEDFWTELCKVAKQETPGASDGFGLLYVMLNALCDPDDPLHGSTQRKVLITKAWRLFVKGEGFTEENLQLAVTDSDAGRKLCEFPTLGGIDLGDGKTSTGVVDPEEKLDPVVTEEEVEARKAEAQAAKNGDGPVDEAAADRKMLADLKAKHPGYVIVFDSGKEYLAWEDDATITGNILGLDKRIYPNSLSFVGFAKAKIEDVKKKFKTAKKKIAVATKEKDGTYTVVK